LVRVKPYSEEHAREVATAIKDRLGKDGVGVPLVFYQKPDKHWGRPFVEGMVLVLQVMAIASLVMSVVLVFNTLTALITQQTDQIGILKAIGGTSGTIQVSRLRAMSSTRPLKVELSSRLGERFAIPRCKRAAPRRPPGEERQARAENRCLHLVKPAVDTRLGVVVAIRLSAVAQPLQPFRESGIARHDRPGVAERTEILRRVEAEGARDAERPDRPSVARRQVRLAAVFDERQGVPFGDS
jgi:hypothetical protein